jgi:phosphoribosyl-ATP pyrophosphohydrolase
MSSKADSGRILEQLAEVLAQRRTADPEKSYVARLHRDGLEAILRKIEEETGETLEAARAGDARQLAHEVADLWFHTLVLLSQQGLGPSAVLDELARRFGVSGLDEKAARGQRKN